MLEVQLHGWAAIGVLSALLWPGAPDRLDDEGDFPNLRGTKIVVPDASGKPIFGTKALTRTLRSTLKENLGPLVPSRSLKAAQKSLRLQGSTARTPTAIARAARATDAEYALTVGIKKEGWRYTARARLIRVEDGEVQMDFRSQFFKPRIEAADRGRRIARRVLERLAEIRESEGPEPMARAPRRGRNFEDSEEAPREGTASRGASRVVTPGSPTEPATADPAPAPPPASVETASRPPERKPWETPVPSPTAETQPPPTSKRSAGDMLHASLGGGAGVLRKYDLSSGPSPSSLSYQLVGLGLVSGEVEFAPPDFPIGIRVQGAWRPVRYRVTVPDEKALNTAGMLVDGTASLLFPLTLSGRGRHAYRLTPGAGARFNIVRVAVHRGNRVLSSTAIAAVVGARLEMPINELLDVSVGLDGGYVVSYGETPATNGKPDLGLTLGSDLLFRIWLSDAIGIAISSRLDLQRMAFRGPATRQIPANMELEDASLNVLDLNVTAGVALRF